MTGHSITRNLKKRKTISGKVKIVHAKKKHAKYECAICHLPLKGVPNKRAASALHKNSKTERRPNAPFGGILCSRCRENAITEAAMIKTGMKKIDDISIKKKGFVEEAVKKVC